MPDPHRPPAPRFSRHHGEKGVRPLPRGAAVFTRDGYRLGRVKESNDRCFVIDVPLAFDYWLSNRTVVDFNDLPSVAGGRVPPAATLA